jgi:hypothetical protein
VPPGVFGREHERTLGGSFFNKRIDISVAAQSDRICIVEPGAAKFAVAYRKTQRLYQVKLSTRVRT